MAKKRERPEGRIASPQETTQFIHQLQSEFPREPRSKPEKERLRKYLAGYPNETLRSLMRRALITMVQHPAPAETPTPAAAQRTRRKSRKA